MQCQMEELDVMTSIFPVMQKVLTMLEASQSMSESESLVMLNSVDEVKMVHVFS